MPVILSPPNQTGSPRTKWLTRRKKVSKLIADKELSKVAQDNSDWMAQTRKLSHSGISLLEDRIDKKWNYFGENIAFGYIDSKEVMKVWLESSDHKENIMNKRYTHVGIGISQADSGKIYWCVVYAG